MPKKDFSPVSGSAQLTLDFELSVVERHENLLDCVRECLYQNPRPLKAIAADMDLSMSDLSRKVSGNPDDSRRFTLDDLEKFLRVTGDTRPVVYLAAKYLAENEDRQRAAQAALAAMLPDLMTLIKTANGGGKP